MRRNGKPFKSTVLRELRAQEKANQDRVNQEYEDEIQAKRQQRALEEQKKRDIKKREERAKFVKRQSYLYKKAQKRAELCPMSEHQKFYMDKWVTFRKEQIKCQRKEDWNGVEYFKSQMCIAWSHLERKTAGIAIDLVMTLDERNESECIRDAMVREWGPIEGEDYHDQLVRELSYREYLTHVKKRR
eukprot:2377854-Rhodomonas_salina.1